MIAGEQHRRHAFGAQAVGARVVRAVEQAVLETVLIGRFRIVARAFLQTTDGIDDHRRRQFAARQHVIADGQFLVDFTFDETLVEAFVATADQDDLCACRQLPRLFLRQRRPLRAQINHFRRLRRCPARGVEARGQRLGQHHHSGTTAKRSVIDATIIVGGVVARIPRLHRQQAALERAPHHADLGALADEIGKQADHIDAHQKSASQSTVMRRASKSTSTMNCSAIYGINRSRSPATTITSLAPVSNR